MVLGSGFFIKENYLSVNSRTFVIFFLTAAAWGLLLLFAVHSEAVLGPPGPYSSANGDMVEICADAACTVQTTEFNPGDTVYLRVTSDRVANDSRRSRLELIDYLNNRLLRVNWTQTSFTAPYTYEGSLTLPASLPDYVKIKGEIRDNAGPRFKFEQQLDIVGLNQYAKFYSDIARSDESYTFAPGATIYISAYGNGNTYSARRTGRRQNLKDFSDKRIKRWRAPAVTQAGNWYDFSLTLPASGYTDGDWYWLDMQLRDGARKRILRMSRMVQIDASAPTALITSPASGSWISGALPVDGTADDTYSFYNYVLEYGAGAAPTSWNQIGSTGTAPVVAGTLETWNTTAVGDGLYTLRLTVTDRAYNTSSASVQVNVDNNAPTISAVQAVSIGSASATITWSTDEIADSQVEYGISPGVYTWTTPLDPSMVTGHSQGLAGLDPSTTYYYRVRSADQAGNVSYSTEEQFKTANVTVLQPYPGIGRDTYLGSGQNTWNHGAEASMRAGDEAAGGLGTLRTTLAFDLSTIPAGSTINSATMSLYQAGQADTSTPTLDVHYLTRDWVQGSGSGSATGDGATWLSYDGTGLWATAGGDYAATASASTTAPDSSGAWLDWNLSTLTQSWVNGLVSNYGVLVKQNFENPAGNDAKLFLSSEYVDDRSLRPKLTIEWLGDDVTPPQIGEVRAENVTTTSADIKWSTDEGATTQVDYGTTTSYGSTTTLDSNIVNQHSVPLAGLTQDTVYHYRVRSMDPSGNEAVSGDHVFQTARTITVQPDPAAGSDTWISSADQSYNYGASTGLSAGNDGAATESRRALLAFDLSSIPAGSTINSATMSLYQYAQADSSTPQLGVYEVSRSWAEGSGDGSASGDGATWVTYDGVNSWTTAGGDFNGTAAATANAPSVSGVWLDFDLAGLTQQWVNGTTANHGVLVRKTSEDTALSDYKDFYASDYSVDASLRPRLVIEYVPAPGTITMTIDETWNRDNTPGSSSVAFGNVAAGSTYVVGDTLAPPYAVKLTVKSNSLWGLKVSAGDDLQSTPPGNSIAIANLNWKRDALPDALYQPMVKSPAETVIDSNQGASNGTTYLFDYRLAVPALAVSGSYSTAVIYTAYPE